MRIAHKPTSPLPKVPGRLLAALTAARRVTILVTALTIVTFTTAGAALADVQTANHPRTSQVTSPPSTAAASGWKYQDTVEGNCGIATLVANNDGGSVTTRGQLISSLGAIAGGSVTFIWTWEGGGGRKTWEPKSGSGNWISPEMSFTAPGDHIVNIVMTGYIITSDGDDCSIENPVLQFRD
jgi:hypothetical protein